MARVTRGTKRRKRVKKVLDMAEGFTLGRKNKYRRTIETLRRAKMYAYRDRRIKKRDFRALWNSRIGAAVAEHDLNYSRFIGALTLSQVALNRKMLSTIAISDPSGFKAIVDAVRSQVPAQ